MSGKKHENLVLLRVQQLAKNLQLAESTVCGRAFKDSKKLDQLRRRSSRDADELRRLDHFEAEVLEERRSRLEAG